ncbi:MAG TPA: DUF1223 domain-containing protein [Chromatiales bacterium]|nr:DUF1223 domain-containing protein [Thiotrichales bacterium]HIP68694.1 DUF1223 domain-containing protein [Chromatiales bacterium]
MHKFEFFLPVLLAIICTSLTAEETRSVVSPAHKIALLELYTSEGCNSCPAAERWLGQLEKKGYTSDKVIPIALHVDYWDYLGWRDIYADPRHSKRQQQHVLRNRLATAYTPQLILDGKNLRPSRLLDSKLKKINAVDAEVEIRLSAGPVKNNQLTVTSHINSTKKGLSRAEKLFLVLVEDDINSRIKAGENAGRTLKHHSVTRTFLKPVPLNNSKERAIQKVILIPKDSNQEKLSIVAFVEAEPGNILQAVKLKLVD